MSGVVDLANDLSPKQWHGSKTIGASAVMIFPAHYPIMKGVQLKAGPDNTDVIYIGSSLSVTADTDSDHDGFPLQAGEGLFVPCEQMTDLTAIAGAADQKLFWFAT